MSKRSYLRKSAVSFAATLGLGVLGSEATAQITLPPNLTIGVETITPGLFEGRVAGAFNTTDPNPADRGIKLEPIMAQTPGGNNVEPWPDNITYIYTGEMFFPDNTGTGTSMFAIAEHVDDSTLIRIDGVQRLSNQQWDVPNTTGVLSLPAGWHGVEFRFGEGGGGAGPSDSGGWNASLGLGVDFTNPIHAGTTQAEFTRPVDDGTGTLFRVKTYNTDTSRDNQNVNVTANATLNVLQGRTVPLGALTVANGVTLTVDSPGGATTFTEANLGATATFTINSGTVSSGPLKSAGAVTTITKAGAGTLIVPTGGGSTVTSNPAVNVTGGTLQIGVRAGATSVGTGTITLTGSTLALANDLGVATGPGVFNTTGTWWADTDPFSPIIPGTPDSTNTFGWAALDTKTAMDAKLNPLSPTATRAVPTEINFPRAGGNLVDGGGNDDPNDIFNTGGGNLGISLTGNQDFAARFVGKLNVTTAGAYGFHVGSNDGAVMFVDTDLGPGQTWVKVADNNRYSNSGGGAFQERGTGSNTNFLDPANPGPSITQPAATTLAVGQYDYAVGYFNKNTDEGGIEVFWTPPGGTKGIIPFAAATGPVTLDNTVVVSGNSALQVTASAATLANLRMDPGSSLRARGNALTTGITATGAGTVSIGTDGQPISLTTLSDGGAAVTFAANAGRVLLTRTGGPGPGFGGTSRIGAAPGSTLVASGTTTENTLSGAPVTLSGGTLELISNPGVTQHHTSDSGFTGTFLEDTLEPGSTPGSNYIVFRDQTVPDFTLTTIPTVGAPARAPVNGIEIRNGNAAIAIKFAADQPDGAGGDGESVVTGPAGVNNTIGWNNFGVMGQPEVPNQTVPQALNIDVGGTSSPSPATVTWTSNNIWSSTGRGEENNTATGENRDLMAGYLDTGDVGGNGATVNIAGLPASLTGGGGYDVYVYIKGGINGRGGDYRFGSSAAPPPNFASNVTVTENSTINVTGFTGGQIGNVSVDAGKTLNINGNALKVNDVSAGAGGVVRFNTTRTSEVAGALGGDGTVVVPGGRTVDFTRNGAAATGSPKLDIARGATVNFGPGAAGTFAASAVSTIANEGLLHAATGVTDLSGATMTTTNVPGLQAGLLGGRVAGATNAVDFPSAAASTIDLKLSRAQTTDNNFFGGDNGTWVYTGEIRIPDTDADGTPGPIAFGEQFDDFALLKIDGSTVINNNSWNVAASSGEIERADNEPDGNGTANDGWFTFEGRFGQGGGGVGPNTGWNIGFGIDTNPADSFDAQSLPLNDPAVAPSPAATAAQYVVPEDDGKMSLFRAVNPSLENIRVDTGATLKLGAMVGVNTVNINGTGRLELHGATSKMLASGLNIAGTAAAPTGTLDVTDSAIALDYGPGDPNPAADVRARIIAGRGAPGLIGSWDGKGITSSTSAAAADSTSVGYAVNGDMPLGAVTTFRGVAVDPTTVLIRHTRTGDANLDGVVNDDDVTIVGAVYAPGVANASWANGDFDYNGFVDDDDVTLLGALYNPSLPPIPAPEAGGGVAAVPEPATWLMLTLGGLGAGLFGWRRRRR
jgi:hypothetical protein